MGGLERVYELGKDFRNEGLSPKHNPEFTMLEWYEAYADYLGVAERFERLMEHVAQAVGYAGPHDLSPPWRRESVQDAIRQRTGVDVLAHRDRDSLAAEMRAHELEVPPDRTWAQLVDGELISKHVEPQLEEPTLLLDYPVELSPFAKRHRSDARLVERVHRAQRPRRAARPLRGPAGRRGGGRRGGAALRRGLPGRAGAGDAPHRRYRPRHRPPGNAPYQPAEHPGGRPIPPDAGRLARPLLPAIRRVCTPKSRRRRLVD